MIKTACVTGADHGLGFELAAGLLERGYQVFAGRYAIVDNEALDALHCRFPGKLHTVHMDVSQDKSVLQAAQWIGERTDHIDLLINNAAILGDIQQTVFDELRYQEIADVYNVNAIGPLRVTNALIGRIIESEGKTILNISSEAGSIGACYRTNWFAYSMSKAALNMQTALLHNQLAPMGGKILSVHPGWIQTHMQGKHDTEATYTPAQAASYILELTNNIERYVSVSDKPVFVDLLGNLLPW